MKIGITSDLHGYWPEKIPDCDVFVIAGDLGPATHEYHRYGCEWIDKVFRYRLSSINVPVIGIAGNHDFIAEQNPDLMRSLPWYYLQDESLELNGIRFYGSPRSRTFFNWAFMSSENELYESYKNIPPSTQVLITHTPPNTILDRSINNEYCGSTALLSRIEDLPNLILNIVGHIHEDGGKIQEYNGVKFVNGSYLNHKYIPTNKPLVIEI